MVDKNKRVPLGELSAYERWELPNIGDPSQQSGPKSAPAKEKIKPPTAEQIEAITKQAYEAGFEEGHKDGSAKGAEAGRKTGHAEGLALGKSEGYEQGMAQAKQEVDAQVAKLQNLMTQLVNPIAQQQQVVEEAMLNIAVALSRAVIHRELKVDSSSLLITLSEVLEELPALDSGAVLRVNPSDKDMVEGALSESNSSLELMSDPSVQTGGFLLKTSTQVIDYTVEKRFQKSVQGMLDSAVNKKSSQMQEVPSSIATLSDYPTETLNEELEVSAVTEHENAAPEISSEKTVSNGHEYPEASNAVPESDGDSDVTSDVNAPADLGSFEEELEQDNVQVQKTTPESAIPLDKDDGNPEQASEQNGVQDAHGVENSDDEDD